MTKKPYDKKDHFYRSSFSWIFLSKKSTVFIEPQISVSGTLGSNADNSISLQNHILIKSAFLGFLFGNIQRYKKFADHLIGCTKYANGCIQASFSKLLKKKTTLPLKNKDKNKDKDKDKEFK